MPLSYTGAHGPAQGTVLLVDDDEFILKACSAILKRTGLTVESVSSSRDALERIRTRRYDAIVSDMRMPEADGLTLLRAARNDHNDTPFVLMTGAPTVETAMSAIEHGVVRYMQKPFDIETFAKVVCEAVGRRSATPDLSKDLKRFEQAMATMWMAYQPIVRWSTRQTIAFEALVRCNTPDVRGPAELIELAERTNKLSALGAAIRDRVAADSANLPESVMLFVNLHPADLNDPSLFNPQAPLSKISARVVLEITERANVSNVTDLHDCVLALRRMGYRLAVDDLGAGYAGLTTVAQVHPEFVKLDASLVRNLERSAAQQVVVSAVLDLAAQLDSEVIAEAIETQSERDLLKTLGIDCMQGYFFARPAQPFVKVTQTALHDSQQAA